MIKELIRLANHLDSKGLTKEADQLDRIIKRSSEEDPKYYLFNDKDIYAEVVKTSGVIVVAKWTSSKQQWEICDELPAEAVKIDRLPPIVPGFEAPYLEQFSEGI